MAKYAPLNITPGLPLDVTAVIHFPEDRVWWVETSEFEFHAQIRETKSPTSALVFDLEPFITKSLSDWDVVGNIYMTGAQTLTIPASGYYDLIITDIGTTNARGFKVSSGNVTLCPTVSIDELEG